jgi:hypothetical protein
MISGASTAGSTFPTEPQVTNQLRCPLSIASSLLRVGKNPIHGGYADPYPLGDFSPLSASSLMTSATVARTVGFPQ